MLNIKLKLTIILQCLNYNSTNSLNNLKQYNAIINMIIAYRIQKDFVKYKWV